MGKEPIYPLSVPKEDHIGAYGPFSRRNGLKSVPYPFFSLLSTGRVNARPPFGTDLPHFFRYSHSFGFGFKYTTFKRFYPKTVLREIEERVVNIYLLLTEQEVCMGES